jgi:short-subunit dehydrogenase
MNIIITGASKGLGKAVAEKFAANNNNLFLCSRNEVALYKTMEELQTKYPSVIIKAKAVDISIKEEAIVFGEWVLSLEISIDILVNNAGNFLSGNINDEDEGALEKMMAVNLYGAYHLTKLLLPAMIQKGSGHIFNICSVSSLQGSATGGSYSISKFAMAGFSKNLREEMKPHGIKVTAVYPGAMFTDSWIGSGIDPKRIMEANDVAEMIYAVTLLSRRTTVEDIILRPQLGDL